MHGAVAPAEDTAPHTSQRQRHDGHGTARKDLIDTRTEGRNTAVPGEATFGEDTDHFARGQRLIDQLEGALELCLVFVAPCNRNCLCGAKDEVQHRNIEDLVIHDEAHRPPYAGHEDQRIHEANVVAHHQRGTFVGDVLQAIHAHAV